MPTYEYACKSCDEHVEVVQSFMDDPLTECPSCGGPLRKVFGSIGISFKGSGFYKTDSRKSDSASRHSSPDKDAKAGDKAEKAGEKAEKTGDKADKAGDKADKAAASTTAKPSSPASTSSESSKKAAS